MSNIELFALILGTGNSNKDAFELASCLLDDGIFGMAVVPVIELMGRPDVGLAKAVQVKAALEVARRMTFEAIRERPVIKAPADAAGLLMADMSFLEQEHLRVILLDTRNKVLGVHEVYQGSLNTSLVRVGELFREAVRRNAAAIIMAHNHPSGDPTPSPEDVAVTKAAVEAGKLLDIDVLDHLLIGMNRFVSLKERGLGF